MDATNRIQIKEVSMGRLVYFAIYFDGSLLTTAMSEIAARAQATRLIKKLSVK